MYVVEAEKVGKPKHTEYYPKDFNSATQAGVTVSYDLPLQDDSIGQENCIYIISPTFIQRQALENSLAVNGYTLHLPGNIDRVSTRACETKTSN
jgi:hypothetical protein